jgi:hypothetical protein
VSAGAGGDGRSGSGERGGTADDRGRLRIRTEARLKRGAEFDHAVAIVDIHNRRVPVPARSIDQFEPSSSNDKRELKAKEELQSISNLVQIEVESFNNLPKATALNHCANGQNMNTEGNR